MPTSNRKCAECGHEGEAVEFVSRRVPPKNPKKRKNHVFDTVYLCAECAAKHEGEHEHGPAKVCQQCGAAINPGEEQQRFKTETEVLGPAARHVTVNLLLCPQCAASYDGTSNFLVGVFVVLVVVVGVILCGGLLVK
jgi:hypothetical protein